LQGLLKI